MKYFLIGVLKTALISLLTLVFFVLLLQLTSFVTWSDGWLILSSIAVGGLSLFLLVRIFKNAGIGWVDVFTWRTFLKSVVVLIFMLFTFFGLAAFGSGHAITEKFAFEYLFFYVIFFLLISVGLMAKKEYISPED